MKTNFTQVKSWFTSAINDIKYVLNDLKSQSFARIAFRIQFAVKKLNKAILSLIGLKIEKTHTPSNILEDILISEREIGFDKKSEDLLKKIIKCSKIFEREGTKTRYGILKEDKLTFPEDIYDSLEKIEGFIKNLENVVKYHLILLKETFCITEKEFEDIKRLELYLEELSQWT